VELGWPANETNPNCYPCLFLQFTDCTPDNRCSKMLQIFSKQAPMMDALITSFQRGRGRIDQMDEVDSGGLGNESLEIEGGKIKNDCEIT